jgi:hypothetical protein
MWVDSLIKRTHGHVVEMGGVSYAFNADNGYGCEVTDTTHLARFRGIPEGYQLSGANIPVVDHKPQVDAPQLALVSVDAPQPLKRRTRRFSPVVRVLIPDDQD